MNGRRRPWWRSTYVILAASVLFAAGAIAVGSTFALFSAETDNGPSTIPSGFIDPATGLAVSPSGYDASLTWTPGTHGPVTGQQVYNYDNGSSSSCPASGYSLVANMASASTSSYTASNPAATTLSAAVGVTTLNVGPGGLNNSTTTINTVTSSAGFPSVPFVIQVDSEEMNVTAEAGPGNTMWTVTRGYNSTTAASHANGAAVNQVSIAVASHSGFPNSGNYTINVDSENMTVTSGQGTTSWIVTRGANSTTIAAHSSGAVVSQVPDPVNGHFYCYEMVSTSATSWTATASFPATQMGLVVKSITLANGGGGSTNQINDGDTITIVFNQAPTGITTGTGRSVCLVDTASPAKIVLGDTATCVGATDANDTGVISGMTMSGGNPMGGNAIVNCNNSTFSISSSTLTITVGSTAGMGSGACVTGQATVVSASGSGTYTPASAIKSSAVTDQAPVCTNATYSCLPTTSGNF